MSDRKIENARIRSTKIETERGLSAWIDLDMGGSGQGFGGYMLGGEAAFIWFKGVINVLEAESWEKLPGMIVRVDHDWGKVYRIGHPIKEQWFDPEAAFAPVREAAVLKKQAPHGGTEGPK